MHSRFKPSLLAGLAFSGLFSLASVAGAARFAYIANSGNDTVSVINLTTNEEVDTDRNTPGVNPISVKVNASNIARKPQTIVVNHNGSRVYVSNPGSETITIIDAIQNKAIAERSIPGNGLFNLKSVGDLAITPSPSLFNPERLIVVHPDENEISIITVDGGQFNFKKKIDLTNAQLPDATNPRDLTLLDSYGVLTNGKALRFFNFDPAVESLVAGGKLPGALGDCSLDSVGLKKGASPNEVVHFVTTGDFTVACPEQKAVRFTDINNANTFKEVVVQSSILTPRPAVVAPNFPGTIYSFKQSLLDYVSLIDFDAAVPTLSVIDFTAQPHDPKGLAVNPDTNNVYVTSFSSDEVLVFNQNGVLIKSILLAANSRPNSSYANFIGPKILCGANGVGPGEQCDDNNNMSGDGCSATCEVEPGYICTGSPSVCLPQVQAPICGDGTLATNVEACDDGATVDGDGCSSNCQVEAGYTCDQASPTVCTEIPQGPVCGDAKKEAPEACDDGDTNPGDGCVADCSAVEANFSCVEDVNGKSICQLLPPPIFCGDGIVNGTEICDDGGTNPGDGCAADCSAVEAGFDCVKDANEKSICKKTDEPPPPPPPSGGGCNLTETATGSSLSALLGLFGVGVLGLLRRRVK